MEVNRHRFIVIEGLDGVGKTTTAKLLARIIGAEIVHNPPASLAHVRTLFEGQPERVKRRFFEFGNLVTNLMITDSLEQNPVVLDRWWYSTRAAELSHGVYDMDDALAYEAPPGLLQPDFSFLLHLDETERQQRILTRGKNLTDDEWLMLDDTYFRHRLLEGYRGMGLTEVDITGKTPMEVVQRICQELAGPSKQMSHHR